MQHLDEGTIHAWLDGALSRDEAAGVEQHAAHCENCAAMIADARGMIAGASRIVGALDGVPGGVIPKHRSTTSGSGSLWRVLRLSPLRAALAASLMIAAASLTVVRHERSAGLDSTATAAVTRMAPAQPVVPPAPGAASPGASSVVADAAAPVASAPVASDAALAPASGGASTPARVSGTTPPPARSPIPAPDAARASSTQPERAPRELAKREAPFPTVGSVAVAAPVIADSAKARPAPRLMEVAVTGLQTSTAAKSAGNALASESRRSVEGMMLDSAAARATRLNVGVMREALDARREFADVRSSTALAETRLSAHSSDFVGCYRVGSRDSAALDSLPDRFALAQTSASGSSHTLILPVDSGGRPDSAIVGTWRPNTQGSVVLTLARTPRRPLVLALAGGGDFTAQLAASLDGPKARIVRVECGR